MLMFMHASALAALHAMSNLALALRQAERWTLSSRLQLSQVSARYSGRELHACSDASSPACPQRALFGLRTSTFDLAAS